MGAANSWSLEAISRAGQVVVEILLGVGGHIMAIDTPDWSLDFRLPDLGVIHVAKFLRVTQ